MIGRRERRLRLALAAGLAAVVLLLYAQVVQHGFVAFDDRQYVSGNEHVLGGLSLDGIGWAFTATVESNWHPLTWMSHMLDVELFGVDPGRHHLVSVLLHAANAVLLFLALIRMTGETWPSALVAALFAVHPLRVESVAWASARKDVLSGLFFLLTILAYARYARRPSRPGYVLVVLAFALGLLAKPMLVTLPLVLLLLDVWPLERIAKPGRGNAGTSRSLRALLLEKVPLVALAAASSLVTYLVQTWGGSVLPWETVALPARAANAAVAYVAYLGTSLWPARLAVLYPHPALVSPAGTAGLFVLGGLSAALIALLTGAACLALRSRPYLTVGWLWYLVMLLPVIGIVQVGVQARADRYAYLPLIGVSVVLAWGLRDAMAAWRAVKPAAQLAVITSLGALAVLTWLQAATWKDTITLYRHALAVTELNYTIHNNLGSALPENSEESEAEYRRAIAIKPEFAEAHFNLGTVLESREDLAGARAEYEIAVREKPDWFEPRNNLAVVLATLGDTGGALTQWRELLRRHPRSAPAHLRLGKLLLESGDLDGAIEHFEEAVRLAPRGQEYLVALAGARERKGEPSNVVRHFEDAVRDDPANVEAQFNLAVTSLRAGRAAEAETRLRGLIRLRPDDPQIHNGLAAALAQQGKLGEAEAEFAEALRLDPEFEKARQGLERVRRLLAGQAGAPAPKRPPR